MALTKAQEIGFWKKRIAELEKENAELKAFRQKNKEIFCLKIE